MIELNVREFQRDFANYLARVQTGETIILLRDGEPVAEIKQVTTRARDLRPFGLCAGEFVVPEDFDAPLPEDILRAFEGK